MCWQHNLYSKLDLMKFLIVVSCIGLCYLQARTLEIKQAWVAEIRKLLEYQLTNMQGDLFLFVVHFDQSLIGVIMCSNTVKLILGMVMWFGTQFAVLSADVLSVYNFMCRLPLSFCTPVFFWQILSGKKKGCLHLENIPKASHWIKLSFLLC